MKYDVTVYTDQNFEVEAEDSDEAKKKAVEMAESHHGAYYDWEVEDDDVEPTEEEVISW